MSRKTWCFEKNKPFCSIYIGYMWYGWYSKARLSGELCQKVNKNVNLPLHKLLNLSKKKMLLWGMYKEYSCFINFFKSELYYHCIIKSVSCSVSVLSQAPQTLTSKKVNEVDVTYMSRKTLVQFVITQST